MTIDFQAKLTEMGARARAAARALALVPGVQKNRCLEAMAAALNAGADRILGANAQDLEEGRERGLNAALLDRLRLTPARVAEIAKDLQTVSGLPDPVGQCQSTWLRPNGLKIRRVRVPIGVIAIIYEARPNVTVDAACLCLKAGNAVILRGGSEALRSNTVLVKLMREGGASAGLPPDAVQLVPWPDRDAVRPLLRLDQYIDLVIPRGGEGLIRTVVEHATVPVIKHYQGVCHIYVDKDADPDMALTIIENAKCQRPGVCNAAEAVLIHAEIAPELAPRLGTILRERGVELRGDKALCTLVPAAVPAREDDWGREFLDLILAVAVVPDLDAAAEHIATYGSAHSDAIITENRQAATRFTEAVDSAVVYVNASTRFTDGGQFGMGCEIGISTDRIHARGPMGVNELTTYKYIVTGSGQVRT